GLSVTELKLFAPLAFTKTFAMLGAFLLGVLILPGLARFVWRRRPQPLPTVATARRRVARSVLTWEHTRAWPLVVSVGLVSTRSPLAGLAVLALGLFRLARPLLAPATVTRLTLLENVLAVLVVARALTMDWLPLGPGQGLVLNAVFVGLLLA